MLLVAAPGLLDPNFRRTVVYLIEHRERGSLGVVLNRPSEVALRDVLPAWAPLSSRPPSVFVGGPVDAKTALCLAALRAGHRPGGDVDGLVAVSGPVALVDLDGDPDALAPRVRGAAGLRRLRRVGRGPARGEIARGDWFVVPALPDDVLTGQGPNLWARVLRRQGVPLALLATFPLDARHN